MNLKNKDNKEIIEIAVLSIEIGNNQIKYLKIYNNSIPSKLAYNFCLEYNLDYESLKRLTYEIKNLIIESNKKTQLNKSFEKSRKNDNLIQIKRNKSVNHSPKRDDININTKQKYNFKDITKEIKKPIEFDYIIKYNKEQNIIEEEKNNYINRNTNNINNNKKEISRSSYLSPTESSKCKIRNQKLKMNKSFESEGKKLISNNNIKIINIMNNDNLKNVKERNKVKSERNKSEINYGEILYDKCMKMKKISDEKIIKQINLEQKKELDECTFKPKINTINIKCFKNNNKKILESPKKSEKIRANKNKSNNTSINKIKINHNERNEKNNLKNQKRQKTARKEISIYERLYNLRNQKKEEEKNNKEKLFIPKINNKYTKNINKKSFRERQKIYSAKSTERKKNLEKQINTKYDSKTGQKLFHPSINKNYYNKNKMNNNYSLSLDKRNGKLKKEKIKKDIIKMIKSERTFKANMKSDNIFGNNIIKSFNKIFSFLDIYFKGELSPFNYSTKNLPKSIKNIILPILNEIDSKNKTYNEKTFINECKKLYKNLDYYSKRLIYKFSEDENYEQNDLYVFSPFQMNKDLDNDIIKLSKTQWSTSNDNKENEDNNKNINKNKKLDVNDYYINGKYSKIYERFYNNKANYKESSTKLFENLIIQRDDFIL